MSQGEGAEIISTMMTEARDLSTLNLSSGILLYTQEHPSERHLNKNENQFQALMLCLKRAPLAI